MADKKQNKELVVNHFYTEKVEMFDNEFLLFRTTQSKDVWQFRMWNGTTQSYTRKSTRQRDIERAKRVGTQYWKEILATQDAETVNNKKKREKRKGKGCKTLESFYLFEGEVKVYRVAQSGNVWQIYIWIREEQKAIKKSLRTKDTNEARRRAEDIYLDYRVKERYGQAIFDKKAKELADMYIEYQQSRCKQGSITQQFVKTLQTRMNHYL
ncbi:MAG: hypothetical protein KZQ64_00185 [gamma proteobacterium symbiont of Bathyaustriella thionipta]|nr:hypothetical protein [gamma proteobacterium symbiont of Bathyaustriella thionipta]MCU7951237.1 hypothetical protein [gamma proteobacterium symbiont of Bathyaustriella thionipta]MCU7951826.1 hypothetical protein [gamma proteobacterium symbiont of Bathyaustriella thionipta]MCU7957758.1 hypothetical protein [gamma proteobacterium symbiont of Bathyaustriella thionipta]MCU7967856.1 hypothetical protein [gamma proteobacterium symbiont of Bathyaustriella thionipta]